MTGMNSSVFLAGSCLPILLLVVVWTTTTYTMYTATSVFFKNCTDNRDCINQLDGPLCVDGHCGCNVNADCTNYTKETNWMVFPAGPNCNAATKTCSCTRGGGDCLPPPNGLGSFCQDPTLAKGVCGCNLTSQMGVCGCNYDEQCDISAFGPKCLTSTTRPSFCGCDNDDQCKTRPWGTKCDRTIGSPTFNRCGCASNGDCNKYSYGSFCKKPVSATGTIAAFGVCSCFDQMGNSVGCEGSILGPICGNADEFFAGKCGCRDSADCSGTTVRGPTCELVPGFGTSNQCGCCSAGACKNSVFGPNCNVNFTSLFFRKCVCDTDADCLAGKDIVNGPRCDQKPTSKTYKQCICEKPGDCSNYTTRTDCDTFKASPTFQKCVLPTSQG